MRVTCTNCGGAHTPWDCKRPAKKSGASPSAESAKPKSGTLGKSASRTKSTAECEPRLTKNRHVSSALPVDTSRVRKKALAGEVPSVNEQPETEGKLVQVQRSHSASIQKRPRGRPKSITDMAAYKAAKQREYRAKWKGRG